MKINHNFFSDLAFNIAENHLGKTKMNPSVGCVIVKNKSVISSGVTSINGRPHAEYNALKKNSNFRGSRMYLTLEPCTHYGLTPPCTKIIKAKGLKKVYYCFEDPDFRTYKKAKKELKNKIFKIKSIKKKNQNFYKSYFINKKYNLPLVDAKIAISNDYFTINKKNKWITNLRSRSVAHLLRSKYDSIISTSTSINKDNSMLNCRIDGFNIFKPDLFIIDRSLKLKKKLNLFNISHKRKTYIITTSNNKKKISFFKKKKLKIIKVNKLENKKDFLTILKKIYKLGYSRVLVESGLIFLSELLQHKLINELFIFKSNNNLKKNGFNNTKKNCIKKMKLRNKMKVNLNDDNLYKLGF